MASDARQPLIKSATSRFTARLNVVLTQMGAPYQTHERARFLSINVDCDLSIAFGALAGLDIPDTLTILKICEFTGRSPGYYLDEAHDNSPKNLRIAKPLGPGPEIAIALPCDESNADSGIDAEWTYLSCIAPMGFGVLKGSYLINCKTPGTIALALGRLYLFGKNDDFHLRQCSEINDTDAVFIGNKTASTPGLVRTTCSSSRLSQRDIQKSGFTFYAQVIAIVRDLRTQRLTPVDVT